MNKIEQMHLDAMIIKDLQAASKSAEITEQIAIEFVQWYENRDKSIDENMLTWEDYYKEFLKTKQ
jgi:hypothetical protein